MLSSRQRKILAAVCEAILPATSTASDSLESLEPTIGRVEHLIASLSDPGDRTRLLALLTALDSSIVNLLLSGRPKSIAKISVADRQAMLETWAHSRFGLRRAGFQALKRLANVSYYCWPEGDSSHAAWRKAGYPGPLPPPDKYLEPLQTLEVNSDTTLDCDVVIVGSGAGGGVVAGVLAAAGHSVVVLEKGVNLEPKDMTQVEGEMLGSSYLDGGLLMTQSGSMPILAGSCVGGGTVINYTTSFPLPERVRSEWDELSGLSLFSSSRFAESLDRVSTRLNVGTQWTTPGKRDEILERGLKKLGWHVDVMQRNVTDCPEGLECGYCGYGCRHGTKNDTARTYLLDAVAVGARIIAGCNAEKVHFEKGRATGVSGTVKTPNGEAFRLTVRAPVVVAACGALHTPALLKRSSLSNQRLGRGLRLHPASGIMGVFPERVEPWSGSLQTRFSDQFADIDGGYGVKFETAPIHFALPASAFGWESAERYREDVGRIAHTGLVGLLLRDRDPGRLSFTKYGQPRVHYDLSRYDAAHMHRAICGAAEVLAAAGAFEIVTLHSPPVRVQPGNGRWLENFSDACAGRGYRHCRMSYITFHQMASACMGADPKRSVVGETGESHHIRGLYVADASTFPTSSGVNPMITIMAIADHVARSIDERS
jgi:choline dehydrogenase-like flavoprotein